VCRGHLEFAGISNLIKGFYHVGMFGGVFELYGDFIGDYILTS
jgi:hypothetical protein